MHFYCVFIWFNDNTHNLTQDEVAHLKIKFNSFFEDRQENVKETDFFTLIGSLGGNLGIWCGISVMTVCELTEYLVALSVLLLTTLTSKLCRGKYDDMPIEITGAISLGDMERELDKKKKELEDLIDDVGDLIDDVLIDSDDDKDQKKDSTKLTVAPPS